MTLTEKWSKLYTDATKKSNLVQLGDTLKPTVAVQTCFPLVDWAMMCGGFPLGRVSTITGPTAHGKTQYVLGLAKTWLDRGLPVLYIDAEKSLEQDFTSTILGAKPDDIPNLFAPRERKYYHHAVAAAHAFFGNVRQWQSMCDDEYSAANFGGLVIVDSITKLTPESELADVMKDNVTSAKAKDSAVALEKGRTGQRRANTNQAWLDQLVGEAEYSNCAVVLIAQERAYMDEANRVRYKPKGGACLEYDASLVIRIKKAGKAGRVTSGNQTIAQQHIVEITKSKVARLEEGYKSVGSYYWSTGFGSAPMGLDTTRDIFEAAKIAGVITGSGWYTFGDVKYQGERFYDAMRQDPELTTAILAEFRKIEAASRATRRGIPGEIDPDTGEVF